MASREEERQAAIQAAQREYEEDAARIQENIQKSMDRAAKAASEGNLDRQQTWLNSVDRYERILESEKRLLQAALNLANIKYRSNPEPGNQATVGSGDDTPPRAIVRNIDPTPPTPADPPDTGTRESNRASKTAPIDTILFNNDDMPIELMFDLIFEDIGGQELINIARNDTINGQNIIYQPIKNLSQIQRQYNPNNILSLQDTMDKYFQNFPIIFEDKIPEVGNGPNGSFIYIDPNNGDLVLEVINFQEDEQLQVDIVTSGTILYEENL
jgi:hypothetical protein